MTFILTNPLFERHGGSIIQAETNNFIIDHDGNSVIFNVKIDIKILDIYYTEFAAMK